MPLRAQLHNEKRWSNRKSAPTLLDACCYNKPLIPSILCFGNVPNLKKALSLIVKCRQCCKAYGLKATKFFNFLMAS